MHKQFYQKILFQLSLFGIVMSILVGFYDVIFGSVLEFFHLIIEVIEITLDRLIEYIFHTDPRQTELIVFYILLSIGSALIYWVWKLLIQLFSGVNQNLKKDWMELKDTVIEDWQSLSMMNRIIWISAFLLVNYLATFLLF